MVAYVIAEVNVHNPERYADYTAVTPGTVEKYGGKFIVRGGNPQALEGAAPPQRVVVIEFATADAAKAWYNSPDYSAVINIRQEASDGKLMLVEGA